MVAENRNMSLKQLAAVHEELKVLAISLSSIRVIDPREMSKELNDHIANTRTLISESHKLSAKERKLLEDINDLAQTCIKMVRVRRRLETNEIEHRGQSCS
ncbi:uncharacterized protein CXQ87_003537 [Candidozyma duobushaemuli]|uniref:Uncharacterized protein n=1 Tax=Candidozyma duobushaemuli TaxID=1231522 RepID=A0A2V1AFQ4_9ASCO|nr:uncharacterized protein CXQ87_003537 [[Candida] duobushaemulonis]PVH15691.1 hypothetical protein CXQ87_003537 [[Candida] duobushaemulonis]